MGIQWKMEVRSRQHEGVIVHKKEPLTGTTVNNEIIIRARYFHKYFYDCMYILPFLYEIK